MDHLFDNHHLCDASWCHKKSVNNDTTPPSPLVEDKEERNKKTYYRSMVDDAELYEAMAKTYRKCINKEYLLHCQRSFDTQINEGMNNSIADYSGKGKHYARTSSLITQSLITAGVYIVGYHHFWISCSNLLEVTFPYQLHLHLLFLDKEKAIRYHRDYDF